MKRKIKYIIALMVIMMPEMVIAKDLSYVACGEVNGIPAPVPQLTSIAFTLLIILTPIILIAFSIITLVKAITSGSQDDIMKSRNKLLKKFLAAGIIFVVAAISQFIITKAADASEKNTIMDCINCFLYNEGCIESDSGNDVSLPDGSGNVSTGGIENLEHEKTGSSLNPNSNTTSTSTIFVGDSKTVGMCSQTTSSLYTGSCKDYYAVAQTAQGYSWFSSTAINSVNNKLTSDSSIKYNIVILLGINDLGNSSSYLSQLKTLASGDWKNHKIIFASVTPVDETVAKTNGYSVTQSSINTFNSAIKSGISSSGVNNLSYCDISNLTVNGKTTDGVHYTTELYNEVYNLIKGKCL